MENGFKKRETRMPNPKSNRPKALCCTVAESGWTDRATLREIRSKDPAPVKLTTLQTKT